MFGIESASEFGESHAPPERLDQHHGHTLFFRTREAEHPVGFPDVPWATEVAKDFADLEVKLSNLAETTVMGRSLRPSDPTKMIHLGI